MATRKKQVRKWEWQDWPEQTLPHYKNLFDLQERLRARLKLAQELAVHNLEMKYPSLDPRKTSPIPIPGKQPEDYLDKYKTEQLPYIRYYLSRMQGEIEQIKRAFTSGRRPNWYKQTLLVEELAVKIWKKMDDIEVHLILTLKGDSRALKKSNEVVIDETKLVIETARQIRTELTFLLPDQTAVGPDEFGIFDTIIDSAPLPPFDTAQDAEQPHFMDLTTTAIWQQDQHRKKRG